MYVCMYVCMYIKYVCITRSIVCVYVCMCVCVGGVCCVHLANFYMRLPPIRVCAVI